MRDIVLKKYQGGQCFISALKSIASDIVDLNAVTCDLLHSFVCLGA